MPSRKKRKRAERPTIHPRNKYSNNPPDFALLASLYPSFEPYVFYSGEGRPRIDWTDYNATRELTRVLLLHDHGINWWIPDGQLCPTVPNRSNYIHWIEDLLSSNIIANSKADQDLQVVRGFDIGTGANCIYPLLGASLLGWTFVGSDVTDVAIEWAEKNVKNNPHISHLIEIRKADSGKEPWYEEESGHNQLAGKESDVHMHEIGPVKANHPDSSPLRFLSDVDKSYHGPPILLGVVKYGEKFDFCMCNPPFFGTMEGAGLNPKTSCGGTPEEMVCPGGEEAFVSRIIEDSVQLKQSFWWFTSMVGKKSSLKVLMSKLRDVGVTVVKTTEFVQGQTCRWGLAWSFMPAARNLISSNVAKKNGFSFMLEGLQRQYSAIHVLQSIESFFCAAGASCKTNVSTFIIDVTASGDHCDAILKNELRTANGSGFTPLPSTDLAFRISVFQQIPGTLLVRGSLQSKESPAAGAFSSTFGRLEEFLKDKFCK